MDQEKNLLKYSNWIFVALRLDLVKDYEHCFLIILLI